MYKCTYSILWMCMCHTVYMWLFLRCLSMDCCCSFDQLKHFSSTSHCKLLTCLFFSFLQIPVQAKMLVALVSSSSRLFLFKTITTRVMQSSHVAYPRVNISHCFVVSWFRRIFSLLLRSFPLSSHGFSSVFISLALGIRLTSIYMLRCWGDATSWDFFTALPLHSFSLSRLPPLSFLYLFEHL